MANKKPLNGVSVLVTRPDHQADALCDLVESAGGKPIKLPMLEILPPQDEDAARRKLSLVEQYDWLIFTSMNAAQGALRLAPENIQWPDNLASIGSATAKMVRDVGIGDSIVPESGRSSEALLQHPQFFDVEGKRILIIKGEGGRDLLSRALLSRGASVDSVDVYRRVPAKIDPDHLEGLADEADVMVITSGESLEQLASLTKSGRSALYSMQLVVPSQRVVQMAEELGFICTPLVPKQISDQAILDELITWRK